MLRAAIKAGLGVSEVAISPLGRPIDEITQQRGSLDERSHRPWPPPDRPWLMGQTWRDLLFAHWRVEPAALAPLIPEPLELDVYDGHAWLGITPFEISGLRARGTPPVPWLSRFPELNVRTYVRFAGKPGIYFFSLDAARAPAVAAARRGYRLPYFRARMRIERRCEEIRYESARIDRSGPTAALRAAYRPTGRQIVSDEAPLARWLTERYCVYVVDERGRALRGDIHHRPWPLQPATVEIELNTMARPLGIELDSSPLVHYSARQDTLFWTLEPVERGAR